MTTRAADDFDAIGARLHELRPQMPRVVRVELSCDGRSVVAYERSLPRGGDLAARTALVKDFVDWWVTANDAIDRLVAAVIAPPSAEA